MSESVLDRIVADVLLRLEERPEMPGLVGAAQAAAATREQIGLRSLHAALSGPGPAVIAECKKASPSAGLLRVEFDAPALAKSYTRGGASAISVVTEPDHFMGDPVWLALVRRVVPLPVLRKDFIVTARQLYEASIQGADAVLLIARLLEPDDLAQLLTLADELRLEVLLEIFADEEPSKAIDSGARIIGVNARDLATFEMRLDRVEDLAAELPADRIRVAESGIQGPEDIERLHGAGYDAFLVGEHLVRSENPSSAIRSLLASGDERG